MQKTSKNNLFFTVMMRTRNNRLKNVETEHTEIQVRSLGEKILLTMRHSNRLPKEVVVSPPLKASKGTSDRHLSGTIKAWLSFGIKPQLDCPSNPIFYNYSTIAVTSTPSGGNGGKGKE